MKEKIKEAIEKTRLAQTLIDESVELLESLLDDEEEEEEDFSISDVKGEIYRRELDGAWRLRITWKHTGVDKKMTVLYWNDDEREGLHNAQHYRKREKMLSDEYDDILINFNKPHNFIIQAGDGYDSTFRLNPDRESQVYRAKAFVEPDEEDEDPKEEPYELHRWESEVHPGTLPAGSKMNFTIGVKKGGEYQPGVDLVFETPEGEKVRKTESNGYAGVHGIVLPTGGMMIKVRVVGHPETTLSIRVEASGTYTPPDEEEEGEEEKEETNPEQPAGRPTATLESLPNIPVQKQAMKVLIIYLDTGFAMTQIVDVRINNTIYRFSSATNWNSSLGGARGLEIDFGERIDRVAIDPQQAWRQGLNNHGFGFASVKLMQKHPNANLRSLDNNPDSINYWAASYENKGILNLRSGFNATLSPNPDFWRYNLPPSWSASGKFVILVGGIGRDHPSFPNSWHP